MKKLISLVLALAMALSMTAFAIPVMVDTTADAAIECMYNLDIMRGDEGGFRPDDYLTRQEMFAIMYRLYEAVGAMDEDAQNRWQMYAMAAGAYVGDMGTVDGWATPYAAYNWVSGIFVGDEDGNLNPHANLSYLECATVLLRALGYSEAELTAGGTWALNVLQYGEDNGLWEAIETTDFNAPITRVHIAMMIYNALKANFYELLSDNFGFEAFAQIEQIAVVTAYYAAAKQICLNDSYQVSAADIGLADEALPGLYGQIITFVVKDDGKVLRAATVEDGYDWVEFTYKGSDGAKIEPKGFKDDKVTEVDYTADDCAYVQVTVNGETYVIPCSQVFESWNDLLYSTRNENSIEGLVDREYYAYTVNTIRFTNSGARVVFFSSSVPAVVQFEKDTSSYTETDGKSYISINGSPNMLASGNLISGLSDGDVIVIDYEMRYGERVFACNSITRLSPISVNGGLLTADYDGGWTNVKYNGSSIGLTNGVDADELADADPAHTSLYALPEAEDTGDKLGYIYLYEGYIVYYNTATYTAPTTPEEPDDLFYMYITDAPTYAFDGALMSVSVTGFIDGVLTNYTVTLANELVVGEGYTLATAGAVLAEGNIVIIDPMAGTVSATGQKVDVIENIESTWIGVVTRWLDIEYNDINNEIYLVRTNYDYLISGTSYLSNFDNTITAGLVEDNLDDSTVEGNTVAAIVSGTNTDFDITEISKMLYYNFFDNEGHVQMIIAPNPDFDAAKRALWDSGVPGDSTSEYYLYVTGDAALTIEPNGDILAVVSGYVKGVAMTKTMTFASGTTDVVTLAADLSADSLVLVTLNETTGYATYAGISEGVNAASGYVIRYVNESYGGLDTELETTFGMITIGAADQVIVGSYAEERIDTLATAIIAFNAATGKTYSLADLAKTCVFKYTADGVTYVVCTANSSLNADKRAEFDAWIDANPDWTPPPV